MTMQHKFGIHLLAACVGLSSASVTAQEAQERVTLKGHPSGITGVAFSPDGKQIASASAGLKDEKSLILWDAGTGKEIFSLRADAAAGRCLAFSPDGKRVVTTDSNNVAVWDAATGQEVLTLGETGGRGISSVAFSPDGKRVARAGQVVDEQKKRACGVVKVWDAATGKEVLSFKHPVDLHGVAFSPDGKQIVTGAWVEVKVWDAATGKELLSLPANTGGVYSVAFSPDGKRIAAGLGGNPTAGEVKVWDAAAGKELLSIKSPSAVASVAFSPNGRRIASGGRAEDEKKPAEVKVWDADTGKELYSLPGHTGDIFSVAFSPDGKRIVSGSRDKTVRVWDIPADK
ncbi:MAG TPA: WD40 repeat domain-containing protein [Gemmataceae bacterium]|jgi:WD40 repeat protein